MACRSRSTKHCSTLFPDPHASFSLCCTQGHLQCSEMMSRSAGHRAQRVTATCRTPRFRPSQLLIALLFFCCNFVFAAAAVAEDPRGESGVAAISAAWANVQPGTAVWLLAARGLPHFLIPGSFGEVTGEGILFFLHVWVWPNWQRADRKGWVYWHISANLALSLTFIFTLWWSDWEIFHPALSSFDSQSYAGEQDMVNKTCTFHTKLLL